MAELSSDEIKQEVLKYLGGHGEAESRKIAKAINVDKKKVDAAVKELVMGGKVEYVGYGGLSYLRIKK